MNPILRVVTRCILGQALLLAPCLGQAMVQPAPTPAPPAKPVANPTTPLIVSTINSPCYSTTTGSFGAGCATAFTCSNKINTQVGNFINVICPGYVVTNTVNSYATVGTSQGAGNGGAEIVQSIISFPLLSEYFLTPCTTGLQTNYITFAGPCPSTAPSCPVE